MYEYANTCPSFPVFHTPNLHTGTWLAQLVQFLNFNNVFVWCSCYKQTNKLVAIVSYEWSRQSDLFFFVFFSDNKYNIFKNNNNNKYKKVRSVWTTDYW